MSKQVLVYICSPYKAVFNALAQNTAIRGDIVLSNAYALAIGIPKVAAKSIQEQSTKQVNYIPFSPVLYFKEIYPSFNPLGYAEVEEKILEECLEILKRCDLVFVVNSPYTHQSKGILKELECARSLGKEIIFEGEGKSMLPEIRDVCNYEEWLRANGFCQIVKGEKQ